jgi:(p)ppGpp synthase/HD superfamily hydrolase
MSSAYSARLDDAVALAMDAFRGTRRKGTTIPYVTHLLQVMVTVGEHGGDEDQLIAAVLHDYLEDIPGATQADLGRRFGERPARLVAALTDATTHPKPPWRPRKEAYLAHLRHAPGEVKLISAADKLHNCLCIRRDFDTAGHDVWSRFAGGKDGTLWYYDAVSDALAHGWEHSLSRRLRADVDAMLGAASR